MRLVSFDRRGRPHVGGPRFGVRLPGTAELVDVELALEVLGDELAGTEPRDFREWFDLDGPWLPAAARTVSGLAASAASLDAARAAGAVESLSLVRLLAPVPRPGKIVCVGLNYRDHAAEARLPVPESPVLFAKFPTAVVGPDTPIVLPLSSDRVDFEAELAVVVGRRMKGVSPEEAPAGVLGYTNANDVSARDFQKLDGQWVRSKSCDTFAPLGPSVITANEAGDPHGLRIQLRVNGQVMQDSSTDQLVFRVPDLLAFIAETITLEPGDVVLTGTPPGVGFARRPPVFLRAGDVVEVEIGGFGCLRNPVTATAPPDPDA